MRVLCVCVCVLVTQQLMADNNDSWQPLWHVNLQNQANLQGAANPQEWTSLPKRFIKSFGVIRPPADQNIKMPHYTRDSWNIPIMVSQKVKEQFWRTEM